jgi:hypothetical protein
MELFSKDFEFMIMNVMLLQEPYTIVKYLETKLKGWISLGKEWEVHGHGGLGIGNGGSANMLKFKSILNYFNVMIKQ